MNRPLWQMLAEERIQAAQSLLAAQLWSSAYYLAGYAVEFGLKSCILAHVADTGAIFKDRKFSDQCWTHDIEDLVKLTGLKAHRDALAGSNALFGRNWLIVGSWSENSRYERKTALDAQELYFAITDATNGVMPWIRSHW